MRFNIAAIEPPGYVYGHFLDDGLRLVLFTLESLGYDCTLSLNRVCADRLNIVWGGHCLTKIEDIEAIASAGPYIAIHSEVLRPNGLNTWDNQEAVERVYLPFLRGAIAVWDGKPESLQTLRDMGFPAYQLRGGYHPRFEDIIHKKHKDIDFSFFGSSTPHRALLFDTLRNFGYRVEVMFDSRKIYRDDLIARTKVHLAPRQSPELSQLAWQRVGYLICNRGLCVVERTPDQQWMEHCFESADTEEWVERCIETLHRSDREELAEKYYQRYRLIRAEDGMARLLEETLGGRSNPVSPAQLSAAR